MLCSKGLIAECTREHHRRGAGVPLRLPAHLGSGLRADRQSSKRRWYHRLAAQWLELRPEGRLEQQQEQAARHLQRAGERRHGPPRAIRRAADGGPRALLQRQGDPALHRARWTEPGRGRHGPTRIHLWHDLGNVYQLKGDLDSALDAFERMLRPQLGRGQQHQGRGGLQQDRARLAPEGQPRSRAGVPRARAGHVSASPTTAGRRHQPGRHRPGATGSWGATSRPWIAAPRLWRCAGSSVTGAPSRSPSPTSATSRRAAACSTRPSPATVRRCSCDGELAIATVSWSLAATTSARLPSSAATSSKARDNWEDALSEAEQIGALPLQMILLNNMGETAYRWASSPTPDTTSSGP